MIRDAKSDTIRWFCYEPINWQHRLGYKVGKGERDCRASVHDERSVGFHQCGRVATQTVEGLRFCTQHANKLRKKLEESK